MQVFNKDQYCEGLVAHYETYFQAKGKRLERIGDPLSKLAREFFVLMIPPNKVRSFFIFCTIGMSCDRLDENLIELFVYSREPSDSINELLTFCASFHRTGNAIGLNHTVNIGKPWIGDSECDHGFISLPYLDGEALEQFHFGDRVIHNYWYIPITKRERDFKVSNGAEKLEVAFEETQFDYLDPGRQSVV
jgi:hypothetical protein